MKSSRFLQLPFELNLSNLLKDLAYCLGFGWPAHYNPTDYEGNWQALALRSSDGDPLTVFAHPDSSYQDTPLLQACPHFQDLLHRLRCEKECVRLLRQGPRGHIKTHRDQGLGYKDGVFRLHVPLMTHEDVQFVVDGQRLPMQAGDCWFADFSLPHSVHNASAEDRIHLVIDCKRNAWSDAWFAEAGFDFGTPQKEPIATLQLERMLAELRLQDNPAAKEMLVQIQAELDARQHAPTEDVILNLDHPETIQPAFQNHSEQVTDFIARMLKFLKEIGIGWQEGVVAEKTFLPGIEVVDGQLLIEWAKLTYPGDILHEAGHVAVLLPEIRQQFSGDVKTALPDHDGDELAVILWTYAAALHLNLPLAFVIHDGGYKGGADWLRDELSHRNYIGLPLLVWMGMTDDPKNERAEFGFPKMRHWLRMEQVVGQ